MSEPSTRLLNARKYARVIAPGILQQFTIDFLQDEVSKIEKGSAREECDRLAYRVGSILEVIDDSLIDYHVLLVLYKILDRDCEMADDE